MSEPTAASHTHPLRHCYWVVPGLLLAGEHPNGPTRDKTKDRLKKLLGAGIECFVDLTKATELLRYDTHLPFYVEYTRKAIKDHGTPGSRAQMTEILEYIANSMRAGRPVYVHCRAGIGRTGTVVGCLLVERGLQGNAAIDELNRLWQQCRRSKSWPFIPETDAQATYIREWTPTLENGGFELSSLATAVATVGPMTTAGSTRPGAVGKGPAAGVGSGDTGSGTKGASTGGAASSAKGVPTGGAASGAKGALTGGAGQPAGARSSGTKGADAKSPGTHGVGAHGTGPQGTGAKGARAGAGLSAAAEQARAASLRDELEKGEISPSIRAEIAEAITGRAPLAKNGNGANGATASGAAAARDDGSPRPGSATTKPVDASRGPAPPNAGEEAPWSESRSNTTDARRAAGAAALDDERSPTRHPGGAAGDPKDAAAAANGRATAGPAAPALGRATTGADGMARGATGSASAAGGATARGATGSPEGAQARPTATRTTAPALVRTPAEAPSDQDPLLDPDTLAAARNLRERFLGTMFGLAIGDAVAATTQFRRPGSFTPIGDMIGGGPFDLPRGAWSDDTAMALCLAESLLERDGFDARDQVQRYSRWQQEGYLSSTGQCVGITASTARSLALAKWRRVVFPGSHDPEQLDPEPLSRIASVALFYFASLETTLVQAADSSRTTCQAPAVLDACRRLARALNAALAGQPKSKILAEGGPFTEAAAQTNNTAATALAAALWAFSSTDNFRDAIVRAANVGGNSDVVATVCGQLAGAHYGATAIPQSWRSGLMQKDLIEGFADRLLAHGLVSLSN